VCTFPGAASVGARHRRRSALEGGRGMSSAATSGVSPGIREVELSIRGMTCAACAARVEKRLNAMDEVLATVNFATEKATVTVPPSVRVDRLIEEIEQAGYGAEELAPALAGVAPDAARVAYLRRRLIVAVVFFVPLSDLSVLLSLFPAYRFPSCCGMISASSQTRSGSPAPRSGPSAATWPGRSATTSPRSRWPPPGSSTRSSPARRWPPRRRSSWATACGCVDPEPRRPSGAGCGPGLTGRRETRVLARPSRESR
jgi:copper chaperone CopZ